MYERDADEAERAAELAALGLLPSDFGPADDGIVECWPENLHALNVLIAMGTQWNTGGMGGVTGLKYESLPAVMRYAGVPRALHADTFEALRVMEVEAMSVINRSVK